MKNKFFYPAFALLLFANIFVFCTKEDSTVQVTDQDFSTVADDRTGCLYKVYGNVRVCGTMTNNSTCTSCVPNSVTLTGVQPVNVYWGSPLPVPVGQNLKLKICNPSGSAQNVTIITNGGGQLTFTLQNGLSRNVYINGSTCSVSADTGTCDVPCNM